MGTALVVLAALAAKFPSVGISEQSVLALWGIGVIVQIVAGVTAIYRHYYPD